MAAGPTSPSVPDTGTRRPTRKACRSGPPTSSSAGSRNASSATTGRVCSPKLRRPRVNGGVAVAARTVGRPLVDALTFAQRRLGRGLASALSDEGATVDQWRLLRVLGDGQGHPMGELATLVHVPHATLTRIVDGLVDSALVYRRQSVADRRRVDVFLSTRGRTRLRRLEAIVAAHEDAVAEAVGRDRLDALRAALAVLDD
ncbi:MAG: MarR family transcriptional regulator [Streptosporangiales bacterium]|nr:MarR family transcriptional regulator [Streptosporangiales bacterium]